MRFGREPSVLPGFGLTFGFTAFFLCAIVLLPLTALVMRGACRAKGLPRLRITWAALPHPCWCWGWPARMK